MSPSPASLTEADDFCKIDVTSVAIHSVTLLVSLCGLVGNGAVLWLLSLEVRNAGVVLALLDLFFLLFTVPSVLVFLVEDVSCSPIMPLQYLSLILPLSVVSYYLALFRLTFSTNTVYMYMLCEQFCHCNRTMCLRLVVNTVQYWIVIALIVVLLMVTFLCPSHKQAHCRAAVISTYTIVLLLFAAPTVISSTINFIKAKWGSKKQQPKRRDIVIFIIVVCILLLRLCDFVQQLGYTVMSYEVFFLLTCIHSSIKPFIYFLAGSCWKSCSMQSLRLSLHRVFDEQNEITALSNDATMDTVI